MDSAHQTNSTLTPPSDDSAAEANHRIANSLSLLVGLVRVQSSAIAKADHDLSNAEMRLILEGIAARLVTVGQLHRLLAHLPPGDTVDIAAHLREVCHSLVTALSSAKQPVHVAFRQEACRASNRHVQALTQIVCEIVINALKYAHPAGVPVRMQIACETGEDGTLTLEVRDDGVGLPEGFDVARDGGIGFKVIRSLADEIGAALKIESDELGLSFRLTVPSASGADQRAA